MYELIREEGKVLDRAFSRRNTRHVDYPFSQDGWSGDATRQALENFSTCWDMSKQKGQSRYSDGTWAVLYAAEDQDTAVTEVVYHLERIFGTAFDDGEEMSFALITISIEFSGEYGCFDKITSPKAEKLVQSNYDFTIDIAKNARASGVSALRVPSARRAGGKCFPVFNRATVEIKPEGVDVMVSKAKGSKEFILSSPENEKTLRIL